VAQIAFDIVSFAWISDVHRAHSPAKLPHAALCHSMDRMGTTGAIICNAAQKQQALQRDILGS
jgi:hypothetical protein